MSSYFFLTKRLWIVLIARIYARIPLTHQVLDKIKGTIESGSFYEAQQMYKTVYYRYKARKQVQDSYQILKVCKAQIKMPCNHAPMHAPAWGCSPHAWTGGFGMCQSEP